MSVEFRWQVENEEEEWQAPASPPERRRFPWRVVGVLVLLGAGIAVGHFWYQVRQGEARLRRELSTVANLEAQALREGDFETFLSLQDRDDTTWYARQKDRIPSRSGFVAAPGPGQEANLVVVDASLLPAENRAWAEVAWTLEDGAHRRVQFYRQADGYWLRTGVRREYYGEERTRETAHFAFKYRARDEPTVAWMAGQLEAWYEAVCTDFGCDDRRINVLITTLGKTVRECRPPRGFTLSSPRLRGVREDGAPLPGERKELAQILIYLLAARQAGGIETQQRSYQPDVTTMLQFYRSGVISLDQSIRVHFIDDVVQQHSDQPVAIRVAPVQSPSRNPTGDVEAWQQPYLLPQLVNWEMRRLGLADEDTPSTPVLDAVMATQGIEGVQALLVAMGQTTSEGEALRLALGVGLEDLDMVFGQYLAALLAVERQMMEWQTSGLVGPTSVSLARQTFNALLAQERGNWRNGKVTAFRQWGDQPGTYGYYGPKMPLSRPVVDRWELFDDSTVWAEVAYSEEREYPYGGGAVRRIEFFRQVDGAWRHAPPDGRFLGDEVVLQSEHFRLECHEREVDFMAIELIRLESLYRQVADGLQTELPSGERLAIRITYSQQAPAWPDSEVVQLPSPYLSAWSGEPDASYLADHVVGPLFDRLASHFTELARPTGARTMWWGIVWSVWQWDVTTPEPADLPGLLREVELLASAVRSDELILLSELEVTFSSEPLPDNRLPPGWTEDKAGLFYFEAWTIVGYAGKAYGSQAFPALLKSLPEADSIEAWLQMALDVDLETFEADWRAWLREQVAR